MEVKSITGQINEQFLTGMSNRMDVSFYKYGDYSSNYEGKYSKEFLRDLKETLGGFLARWEDRVGKSTTANGNALLFTIKRLALYACGGEVKSGTVPAGNTEYLMDAGNGCMIEFNSPQVPKAKFKSTDSDKSPGFIGQAEKTAEHDAVVCYRRNGD